MSSRVSSSSGADRELLCSRCYKRDSCVQCCSIRFCLRHFHTSNHATEHPAKASVTNQAAFDEQLPAFQEMWREAFESVADDVDRLSRDVDERVAQDPLASIGMVRPDISSPSKQKSSAKSPGASSSATKRRRKKDKDRKEAEAAAAADPFARRRTRPQSYWAVGNDPESSTEGRRSAEGKATAAAAAAAASASAAVAAPRVGEYQCESCNSDNTSFDIIGGAAMGTRKAETFGKKDAPELVLRVVCHACGNNWVEER